MEKILGSLAASSSFILLLIGVSSQIVTNWKRKSTEGLSLSLFVLTEVCYGCWMIYGWFKPHIDLFLVIPNILGLIIGGVLLYQFYIYRKC